MTKIIAVHRWQFPPYLKVGSRIYRKNQLNNFIRNSVQFLNCRNLAKASIKTLQLQTNVYFSN